ncbi:phosphotransferase [Microbacterium sp. zg.Y1090]|uniref:phosphotransferase n=1 Tax=Microbacterium TaxID=33882 RepID=UPI00214C6ECD|nr:MULTISPECIES: phosphotransferase [unclassified Microbacterium]MCR2812057.1 phosphotransferase [Microbacterium sp. zg.Y1084]MCR2818504.1 phosphotransferase [Microbacterium sp. zg.Y1090]MDL5486317.1 phosphotransferase [Microbacterium sp. zg-Y1211]WIM29512.1 phosphotransferase [Microbacterium sp. zg-Y1090]
MARSPFTLAASVTSALPRAVVVGVGELTEGAAGRFDAAVADLDDGRRVVVRVPTSADAADELAAQVRVLRALSAGVRGVLPFRAPEVLGEAGLGASRVVVCDLLPGYRVEAAHVPPGRGVAESLGAAIADVHALPTSVVRDAGLPSRTPAQVRDEAERMLDRAEATGLLPFALLRRWSTALAADALWRFEAAVTLGGVEPTAFLLEDVDDIPTVTGLLDWHGLSVGDPAADLKWLASAPTAAEDVYGGYLTRAHRAPDARLRDRARLHAELEFAKWLVHGHAAGSESVVADAVALLESLAEGVGETPLVSTDAVDVDDALASVGRMSDATGEIVDTSMQTDAYDPSTLSMFAQDTAADDGDPAAQVTQPLELSLFSDDDAGSPAPRSAGTDHGMDDALPSEDPGSAHEQERDESARNALRRWRAAE